MKTGFLSIIFSFLFVTSIDNSANSREGFIKLMYIGEVSKAYPVILLHLPAYTDTANQNAYTLRYEITEEGFEKIRESILVKKLELKDSMSTGWYQFNVVNNGEAAAFTSPYLTRVQEVFNTVVAQFKDPVIKEKVEQKLGSIVSRLKADNRFN